MKKHIVVITAALALSLASCASIENFYNAATGAAVSPAAVYFARSGFDAAEVTATNYLRLPRCGVAGPALCRSPAATKQLIPAIAAGRTARNDLNKFAATNPGALGPTGLYNALVAATNALEDVFHTYNIGGGL